MVVGSSIAGLYHCMQSSLCSTCPGLHCFSVATSWGLHLQTAQVRHARTSANMTTYTSLWVCSASVHQALVFLCAKKSQAVQLQHDTCRVGLQQLQKYSFLSCFAALLAIVAATTQLLWDAEPAAGKLMLPYLVWTAYATVLNAWIWNKNPKVQLPCSSVACTMVHLALCHSNGTPCIVPLQQHSKSVALPLHACTAGTAELI